MKNTTNKSVLGMSFLYNNSLKKCLLNSLVCALFVFTSIAGFADDKSAPLASTDGMDAVDIATYLKGLYLIDNQKYEEGAKLLEPIARKYHHLYAYTTLIDAYSHANDLDKTKEILDEANSIFTNNVDILISVAKLYWYLEDNNKITNNPYTEKNLVQAYTEFKDPQALELLLNYYKYRKNPGKVITSLTNLIKVSPENDRLYVARANFYIQKQEFDKASDDYIKAYEITKNADYIIFAYKISQRIKKDDSLKKLDEIIIKSGNDTLIFSLADYYQTLSQNEKALQFYSLLQKSNNTSIATDSKYHIIISYINQKKYDDALKLLKTMPGEVRTFYFSGVVYEKMNDTKNAESYYIQTLNASPNYVPAMRDLSQLYTSQNDFNNATKYLDLIPDDQKDETYYLIKITVAQMQNKSSEMLGSSNESISAFPKSGLLLYKRAEILFSLQKYDEVVTILTDLYKKNNTDPDIKNFLGYVYAVTGKNLDEAKSLVESALETKKDNPAYLDSLAWIYYKMNDLEKAKKYVEKALDNSKEDSMTKDIKEHQKTIVDAMQNSKSK